MTAPGVWYTVIGNGRQLQATTCPSADPAASATYDTKISVYCVGCSTLQCVKGNDDEIGCSQIFRSNVTWCSTAGFEYHILVHGFSSQTGQFNLAVNDLSPCVEPPPFCAPFFPAGACCTCLAEPFNCRPTFDSECEALTHNLAGQPGIGWLGFGTPCFTPSANVTVHDSGPVGLAFGSPPVTVVADSMTVDAATLIADLDVGLVIDHTWVGDLVVTLTHVDTGTEIRLVDRPGVTASNPGSCPSNDYDIVLDDEGQGGSIDDLCPGGTDAVIPPSPPNYEPHYPLAAFDGELAAGTWTLRVQDLDPASHDGTFQGWSLIVTEATPVCAELAPAPGDACDDRDDEDSENDED